LFKASGKKLDILHQEPLTRLFRFKMAHFEPEYQFGNGNFLAEVLRVI